MAYKDWKPTGKPPGRPRGSREDYALTQEPDDLAEALEPLRIHRQREFVRRYLEGMSAGDAFLAAGYKTRNRPSTNASHLLKQPHIQAAVAAGRAALTKRSEWTFARTSKELENGIEFARQTKNATALMRGLELLGKLHGHLIDRAEVKNTGTVVFQFPNRQELVGDRGVTIDGELADGSSGTDGGSR
jgi:hypothetical protein